MAEFLMPALGADMSDGVLTAWLRKSGERVERGDIIAEVETEKGLIEVEVFTSGVIQRLLVEPGTRVPVGTPLALIDEQAAVADSPLPEPPSSTASVPSRQASVAAGQAAMPVTVTASAPALWSAHLTPSARKRARESGLEPSDLEETAAHDRLTRDDIEQLLTHVPSAASGPKPTAARRRASPYARRRARVLGLDISTLEASAQGRVVHVRDVEREAALRSSRPRNEREAMRHAIASAMSHSKREIPHYYLSTTVDLGPAMAWLSAENARRAVPDRLIPGVLFLKAAALAMRTVPELNARWDGNAAPPLERIHVGVAISLRQGGLVAPAIHDTDRLSLDDLMRAFQDLVKRARAASLRSSEMSDATVTVTSLGERGVDEVFPIIYPPQVAMVGVGRVGERPWCVDGRVVSRPVVTITLAADHRVSDGHRGGLYLAAIERLLKAPEEL